MSLRVIAGTLKGRRLGTPSWAGLRPTSDRLRETLFNIVGPRVVGCRVLDGYAGTGAVGIEALSRGAGHVTFVERDSRAVRLISENLAACGLRPPTGQDSAGRMAARSGAADDRCSIIRSDFTTAVASGILGGGFDLVLLDPPYEDPALDRVLDAAARAVVPGGLVVLEHAARREPPAGSGRLVRTRSVTAGDSVLSFYGTQASLEES